MSSLISPWPRIPTRPLVAKGIATTSGGDQHRDERPDAERPERRRAAAEHDDRREASDQPRRRSRPWSRGPGSLTAIPQTTSSTESPAAGADGRVARAAGEHHHRRAAAAASGGDQRAGEQGRKHPRKVRRPARPCHRARTSARKTPVGAREALELELAAVVEVQPSVPSSRPSRICSETRISPPHGLRRDAGGEDHVLAEEVALLGDHLAGVEAHPDPQGDVVVPVRARARRTRAGRRSRTPAPARGSGKASMKPSPWLFTSKPSWRASSLAEDRVVLDAAPRASARRRGAR